MIINIQNKLNAMPKQKGLVLFIALIALVAMSLAAAALIRSVDTSTLVAGNLAFKQSAVMAGDSSIALGANYVRTNGGSSTLDSNLLTAGYYATAKSLDYKLAATWTAAKSVPAAGAGFTGGIDSSGNTVRYVIERMCRNAGPATSGNCLLATASVAGTNQACTGGCPATPGTTPIYRITSRITGPQNTTSYIQAYIY
jgi:type IV pilus assembly protein PilX